MTADERARAEAVAAARGIAVNALARATLLDELGRARAAKPRARARKAVAARWAKAKAK